jgi:hypothetical protein
VSTDPAGPVGYASYQPTGTPPLSFGDIWDRGVRMWWGTLKTVLPWVVPLAAIGPLFGVLTGANRGREDLQAWFEQLQRQMEQVQRSGNSNATLNFDGFWGAIDQVAGELLVTGLVGFIISAALTAFYADRIVMRHYPARAYVLPTLGRFLPLIAVAMLRTFATAAGLFVFCVGFFVVWTLLAVAPQVCVVERANPFTSLKRSWNLVRRRFLPMLGLLLLSTLLVRIGASIVNAIALAIPQGTGRDVGLFVTGTLSNALGASLLATLLVFAYLDLRVRFENLDLGVVAAQHESEQHA